MAQTISGHHTGLWGVYLAVAQLPNTSGATIQSNFLRKGHLGIVIVSGTPALYICTTSTAGAGVWAQLMHTGSSVTGGLTLSGTLSAEQVTSTDDATVTDDLAITGLLTVGETLGVTGASTLAAVACTTLDPSGLLAAAAAVTVGTTLGVTGVSTFTGGIAPVGGVQPVRQWNHAGEGVLTDRGTSATMTAGDINYCGWIPEYNMTVTNLNLLNGTTVGTHKLIYAIYNLDGTLARSTDLAGATSAGADVYQAIALTATLAVTAGTEYLIAVQAEGTTPQLQFTPANFRGGTGRTGTQGSGAFGTMATISSVATTFTADIGPLFFVD